MTLEELASRLEELEDARKVAEAKIAALQRSQKRTEELKEDREAVLASLTDLVPQALDSLTGEERNKLYRMLRMEITPTPEGSNATGVFVQRNPPQRIGSKTQKIGSCTSIPGWARACLR